MKEITKGELRKLYVSMSNRELAEKLGVSTNTLWATLIRAGIKLKGRGRGLKRKQPKITVIK